MLLALITHEEGEVFYPSIVLIPIEQIYDFVVVLLRDIHWESPPSLVIEEGKDIDLDLQSIFDGGDLLDRHWVFEILDLILGEEMIILQRAICMVSPIYFLHRSYDGVSKAAILLILYVDNRMFGF